ncbi:App1 family protein [Micrococcus sp.]|uniref:App1 family protein n=1 Tax=Micrococcus sp. TaxID=1271 RepID=UPI002A917E2B|nr:phosphatase domain-containing protein [Micrococcus sp.]MDY6055747.1 phosphatase domain-containing protein [Micrococcus sp.]
MSAPQQSQPEPADAASVLARTRATGVENVATHLQEGWNTWQRSRARERGWVPTLIAFTGYGTTAWVRVLSRVVLAKDEDYLNGYRLSKVVADGVRGWRNFISPPMAYAEVSVRVGEVCTRVRADRMGVIDARIEVELEPGWRTAVLTVGDGEEVTLDLFISSPDAKLGMVSDIDDTVVVTSLPRPLLAAWNSFVIDEHARTPTPGMAVLLRRLAEADEMAPVIYLSTGAWNVAQTLTRFLGRNLYPLGALLLTSWGPTRNRWFRSGMEHKVSQLERLAEEFPDMQWVLVGDDGQHDPEIYADFAHRHPDRVKAIVIRQLTPSEALLAGGRAEGTRQSTPGIPWCYGPDGAALSDQLEALGILPERFVDVQPQGWREQIGDVEEVAEDAE